MVSERGYFIVDSGSVGQFCFPGSFASRAVPRAHIRSSGRPSTDATTAAPGRANAPMPPAGPVTPGRRQGANSLPEASRQKTTVTVSEQELVPASHTWYVYDPPPRLPMASVYAPSLAVVVIPLPSR